MDKRFVSSLSLALTAVLSPAHAATVPEGVSLAQKQQLVRANGAEPGTIDPGFVGSGSPGDVIVNDLFEGLVIENLQGEVSAGQAESWTVSPDGKTYTFQLRKGLQWSDGKPLTAQDFVFAWRRAVDPSTGNNSGFNLVTANIEHAQAILAGQQSTEKLGVAAPNPYQLVVSLSKPTPYFLSLMSIKTFFPVPEHQVKAYGDGWTRAEHFVSNGAYVLKQWTPNESVEVVRNPRYWDNGNTVINQVTYLALSSQNAEMMRYQAGEIHMTNRVQLEYYQKLLKESPEQIQSLRLLGSYVYAFNTKQPPFDNPDVRRALSMSIDRNVLVEKVTGQGEPAAFSVVPDIIPHYTNFSPAFQTQTHQSRISEAKLLLAKAGYGASNPLKVTLTYNTSENHKKLALAIASMWKTLGVQVALENMEWNAYLAAKAAGDYTVARSYAFGDYAEPSSVLNSFTCHHVNNETGFCDAQFDTLLKRASDEQDETKRYRLYRQAEQILDQSMPVMPIYHYNHTRLVKSNLKGFPSNNPKGNIYAKDMYFVAK
ncbi:peptide ABC transporter substrate-binding protein [Photobacterium sp. 1_MG-2023]|uniref:peptide ABC transporter substrate-binding protein n=1 Tax=Photobacterium sp. 1_MG-2023 TaxID=3062646 RepID=UPI0026E45E43|nr:peptide ABC transporter substrate-binding protein [Photobacterium sp. 1_MG-2023]MDO6707964.1 peptide ABC transporter substrate-binding protein [Photobacterium sp. 1_MG-2023]